MNLEGFSKKGMELGDDPEGIRETKGIGRSKYDVMSKYSDWLEDLQAQADAINETIRRFRLDFESDLQRLKEEEQEAELSDTDKEIQYLKSNLDLIFGDRVKQSQGKLDNSDNLESLDPALELDQINLDSLDETPVVQSQVQAVNQDSIKEQKREVIEQIISAMNQTGELSLGDIGITERMNILQGIHDKLDAKSLDELEMLLSTYQEQLGSIVHR